jgi:hypothetical protein
MPRSAFHLRCGEEFSISDRCRCRQRTLSYARPGQGQGVRRSGRFVVFSWRIPSSGFRAQSANGTHSGSRRRDVAGSPRMVEPAAASSQRSLEHVPALSVIPGNRRRSSIAAESSPSWSKMARIASASASASVTRNIPQAWWPAQRWARGCRLAEAEAVDNVEGNMLRTVMRGATALPWSETPLRMNGTRRNLGGLISPNPLWWMWATTGSRGDEAVAAEMRSRTAA